jgi:predicted CoA-binding protein
VTDPFGILRDAKTIAVVGASPSPERESYGVMRYLLNQGYRCIPVRPDCDEVLGIPCVPTLLDIDEPIDLVDVFRRPELCAAHAREAAAAGARALWLQLGIVSAEARAIAEAAGMGYVENACTAVVHAHGLRAYS